MAYDQRLVIEVGFKYISSVKQKELIKAVNNALNALLIMDKKNIKSVKVGFENDRGK